MYACKLSSRRWVVRACAVLPTPGQGLGVAVAGEAAKASH
jgi:hypothetical protein